MHQQTFLNLVFGQVRILTGENGDVWFIGKDVASSLGYRNLRSALIQHVDERWLYSLSRGG